MKIHNPLVRNLKLTYSNEDFKLKKLLLNLLVMMSRDPAALQVCHAHPGFFYSPDNFTDDEFSSLSFTKKNESCWLCWRS